MENPSLWQLDLPSDWSASMLNSVTAQFIAEGYLKRVDAKYGGIEYVADKIEYFWPGRPEWGDKAGWIVEAPANG